MATLLLAVGLFLAAGAALVLTSGGEGDALDLGHEEGRTCLPQGRIPKLLGALDLKSLSDQPLTVVNITFVNPSGLTLLDSVVVPATNSSRVYANGWPPRGEDRATYERHSKPAKGFVLEPGGTVTLWLGAKAPSGNGSAEAIRVTYRQGSREYHQDSLEELVVRAGPAGCDANVGK